MAWDTVPPPNYAAFDTGRMSATRSGISSAIIRRRSKASSGHRRTTSATSKTRCCSISRGPLLAACR